jgi:purine nucleoside permease
MKSQDILCVQDRSICQVTTGMNQINAASTIMALLLSDSFDLAKTYFIVSGVAGVNPLLGTLGSVALAKYAVQVALQYQIDSREMPDDWPTGYVAFGTDRPLERPTLLYGTEIFELNENLRDYLFETARNATLADSTGANEYRQRYAPASSTDATAAAACQPPALLRCDVATSDEYYSGDRLSSAFQQTVSVWTGGRAAYCMTNQEDNATLEALLRGAQHERADFGRVVVMRAGSNFDRPPRNVSAFDHLFRVNQNGFDIAVENLFIVGLRAVSRILQEWDCRFEAGIRATNYIGDVWGSLGGQPDF